MVTTKQRANQQGDPSASLLLTSDRVALIVPAGQRGNLRGKNDVSLGGRPTIKVTLTSEETFFCKKYFVEKKMFDSCERREMKREMGQKTSKAI